MVQPEPNFAILRRRALALPGVEEGLHRGGPALRYNGKTFAMWWAQGERTIMKLDRGHQQILFEVRPESFEPCQVGVGVWSFVDLATLEAGGIEALTLEAFATVAPRRLVNGLDSIPSAHPQL